MQAAHLGLMMYCIHFQVLFHTLLHRLPHFEGAANLTALPKKRTFLHQSRLELNKFVDFKMFLDFLSQYQPENNLKIF
jgi:hypothetical protein